MKTGIRFWRQGFGEIDEISKEYLSRFVKIKAGTKRVDPENIEIVTSNEQRNKSNFF